VFKVTDFSTNPKPICDFLLVIIIIDILSRTVSKLSQIIVEISEETVTLHFERPFGGLWTTYTVHLKLIGKCVVEFLLLIIQLIELFLLGVVAEAL